MLRWMGTVAPKVEYNTFENNFLLLERSFQMLDMIFYDYL